ncbi:MAG: hypothetical protein H0W76_29360 [Pyrinomonadaceae bacterium]|nr:hypothetical protein [Pyrinomonadaceae bacterium]
MENFRNLISDSPLVEETIEMLRLNGGRSPVNAIADIVLQLPDLDPMTAAPIISELIRDDWRMRIIDDYEVELVCQDAECKLLDETDFVVVDVETTGPKVPLGRITEIGAYRISRGRIVAEFQTLVNPQTSIPPFIVQLTGITEAMVRQAPLFREVAADWLRFADTAVLVAHNAPFDVRFINCELARVFPGRRMSNPQLCTVALSRRIVPELVNHRLHTLADHFSILIHDRHRAAGDARATAEVFIRMLRLLRQHGVRRLSDARRFTLKNPQREASLARS